MTTFNRISAATFAVALAAAPALAQEQPGRYVMEKTDDGYVRMDTQSGDISICNTKGDQIVCKMAADERTAFQDELATLQDRVAALESRLDGGAMPAARDGLPSEEEFEKGLSYMERFMRRFMGIAKEFEGTPDKT